MINELFVPTAVVVAFTQVWMAIAARRLQWAPLMGSLGCGLDQPLLS